jgi:hypothetical protein
VEHCVGEVDSFLGTQLAATRARSSDADVKAIGFASFHDSGDSSVIEQHPVATPDIGKDLVRGASDNGRREDVAAVVAQSASSGHTRSGDNEHVACDQVELRFGRCKYPDLGLESGSLLRSIATRLDTKRRPGRDVTSLARLCPAAIGLDADDVPLT